MLYACGRRNCSTSAHLPLITLRGYFEPKVVSAQPEELKSKFHALKDAQDVANLLEIDQQRLNYHLYISPRSTRYTTFDIPKRSGGNRKISTPITSLKIIQRKLNQVLQQVYEPRPSVHSFISEHSIVSNATKHLGREWVLNLDLKNFFPSITFPRVIGLFKKKPLRNPLTCSDSFGPNLLFRR